LYWQLKYFGHDNVAILNGGTAAWIMAGKQVSTAASSAKTGNWQATAERAELFATSEEVARAVKDGSAQLVDNRPLAQYLGAAKRDYVYDYGHIPGAKLYANELLTTEGLPARFPPVKDLKQLAGAMGIDPRKDTITYCNSGHLASGGWFVMHELMGTKNVKLYDGSMHQWTREKRPVTAMKME
jgi:thiosulfate/3-mercaptopyruvate sulfurtransferase